MNERKGESSSFFKNIEQLIPKFSSSERVPEVSDIDATVVDEEPQKRRSFFWFLFSRSKAREQEEYDDEEIEEIENVEAQIKDIEAQEEELEEDYEELEEKREGLLQRLFSFLSGKRKDEEEEYDDEYEGEDVDDAASIREQETRATLKIIHKWIGRLPPEQIDQFKRSPDFQKYKDLLEMYNLIK